MSDALTYVFNAAGLTALFILYLTARGWSDELRRMGRTGLHGPTAEAQ